MYAPHPALSLAVWSGCAILGQVLAVPLVLIYASACLLLAAVCARARLSSVLRRSRFLLIALLVLFVFFTPGQRLFDEPEWLPLTGEGLALAGVHVARVLSVIALVALLLEWMPPSELILGLAVLGAPLRHLGADPQRLAVRLSLVLTMVTEAKSSRWQDWLVEPPAHASLPSIRIATRAFGKTDAALLAVLLVASAACLIRFASP